MIKDSVDTKTRNNPAHIVRPKFRRSLFYCLNNLIAIELVVLGVSYLIEGLIVPAGWAMLLPGVGLAILLPFDLENQICTKPDYVTPTWQIVSSALLVVILGWFVFGRVFSGS